jgi:MYXO-CTERM domain-containing protein
MRASAVLTSALVLAAGAAVARATVVYDNTTTAASAGYSEPNTNNPTFGDALSLTQGGQVSTVTCSIFNSTSGGNTGSMLTGTLTLNFYDNTTPYVSGPITNPLLGTGTFNVDFTAGGGLAAGFFTFVTGDLTALNITLTPNILITQQYTQVTGTSTRNGVVLLGNPTVGASPANVFISSTATPAGLYTFSNNANQFAYQVNVTPAPGATALLGIAGLIATRRRRS